MLNRFTNGPCMMADGVGFEPTRRFDTAYTISNRAPSAARTSIHRACKRSLRQELIYHIPNMISSDILKVYPLVDLRVIHIRRISIETKKGRLPKASSLSVQYDTSSIPLQDGVMPVVKKKTPISRLTLFVRKLVWAWMLRAGCAD